VQSEPLNIGRFTVIPVVTSRFRLDGGSMFGVVPKALWSRLAPADDENRIALSVNTLVVRTPEHIVLIEPGMGQKYDEKQRSIYALEDIDPGASLMSAGVSPDDIDIVIPTHLHLDHAGGSTTGGHAGQALSAFPRARFVVQELEWEAALDPGPLERGSYNPSDYLPLSEEGRLKFVAGDVEVLPGVQVELTGGHTRGHQVVRLRDGGEEALYLGDLVPTAAHLKLNWLMAWDLEPGVVYEHKARLLADAARRGVTCFFPHDPEMAGCLLREGSRGSYEVIEDSIIVPAQASDGP
jgi:glyoxylase-like metal-dependent hydrolase (beta-lactamase superfamily II)